MAARRFHDEELVKQLIQRMKQLILERDSKERENGQLKQQNQVLHHQLNNSIRKKAETTQLAENLQQSLNDKDAALQEASQAVSLLQRDLDEKERQKESALQEANQTIERLQNELERQTRETVGVTEHNEALRRNVRELESLLSDAEAAIGITRKRLEESKEVLKVASQDILVVQIRKQEMEIRQLKNYNEQLQLDLRQSMPETGTKQTAEIQQKDEKLKELSSVLQSVTVGLETTDHDEQAGRK